MDPSGFRSSLREFSAVDSIARLALLVDDIEITQAIQYHRSAEHLTDPAGRGADNAVHRCPAGSLASL